MKLSEVLYSVEQTKQFIKINKIKKYKIIIVWDEYIESSNTFSETKNKKSKEERI